MGLSDMKICFLGQGSILADFAGEERRERCWRVRGRGDAERKQLLGDGRLAENRSDVTADFLRDGVEETP